MTRAPSEQQASPFEFSIDMAFATTVASQEACELQEDTVVYPIPIPDKKLDKALEIYGLLYRKSLQEVLAQPPTGPPTSSYLSPTTIDGTSVSVIPSANGDITEQSSLSFDNQSLLSVKEAKAEFTTFDGKKIKTQVRKMFDSKSKAKTALIRCLGSCKSCKDRNVAVGSMRVFHLIAS